MSTTATTSKGGVKKHEWKYVVPLGLILTAIGICTILLSYMTDGFSRPLSNNAPPQTAAATAPTVQPDCPGILKHVHLHAGDAPVDINPGSTCIVKWHADGPTYLLDANGNYLTGANGKKVVVGPDGGTFDNFWTESVQAAASDSTFHYKLVAS